MMPSNHGAVFRTILIALSMASGDSVSVNHRGWTARRLSR
jgi:hypothetical protein